MSPPSGHESPPLHEVHLNKLIVQFCISKLHVQAFKVSQRKLYFIGSSPKHTSCFTQVRERQARSSFVHAFNFADERINSELSHRANYKIKRAIRPKKNPSGHQEACNSHLLYMGIRGCYTRSWYTNAFQFCSNSFDSCHRTLMDCIMCGSRRSALGEIDHLK